VRQLFGQNLEQQYLHFSAPDHLRKVQRGQFFAYYKTYVVALAMDFPGFAKYPTTLSEQHGSSISAISNCSWAVKLLNCST